LLIFAALIELVDRMLIGMVSGKKVVLNDRLVSVKTTQTRQNSPPHKKLVKALE
jgi:hypothetical protein